MYPVLNLGQDAAAPQQAQTPVASTTPRRAPDPGVCCQATPDGGVVCSDGIIYVAGCPKAPEPNVPGTAQVQNGIPVLPTAASCAAASTPAAGTPPAAETGAKSAIPILPILGGVLGGAALATGAYFLFFNK